MDEVGEINLLKKEMREIDERGRWGKWTRKVAQQFAEAVQKLATRSRAGGPRGQNEGETVGEEAVGSLDFGN